ncbi:MAG: Uncharacterized protein FD121_362 [Gallionellaceae bacterium]|nr:MAG: Uncharacterized protein FD121_362 [Gallionellaceae bacterium]
MARVPKVTWEGIEGMINAGFGSGFGENYKSLLQIKRWNTSPVSVQVVKPVPPFKRKCHFFSLSEWYLALLFAWIGAHIREQFPMWPWQHQHPEYDRNPEVDATLPWSEGMQSICRDMGIKHGFFVGTDIPYIWTIDLCLHLPWIITPAKACCLVSVKPLESERYLYIDPLDRGPEKLEAERRYAQAIEVPYFLGDRSLYPGPLFAQLEYLADAAVLPCNHPWSATLGRFLSKYGTDISTYPLVDVSERLKVDYDATTEQAAFLLNHILWNQLVDCDLSLPIKTSLPPRPGGRNLQSAIRSSIQGGIK